MATHIRDPRSGVGVGGWAEIGSLPCHWLPASLQLQCENLSQGNKVESDTAGYLMSSPGLHRQQDTCPPPTHSQRYTTQMYIIRLHTKTKLSQPEEERLHASKDHLQNRRKRTFHLNISIKTQPFT